MLSEPREQRESPSAHPINQIDAPQIKVTRENLDYALKVLKQVLEEEAQR